MIKIHSSHPITKTPSTTGYSYFSAPAKEHSKVETSVSKATNTDEGSTDKSHDADALAFKKTQHEWTTIGIG